MSGGETFDRLKEMDPAVRVILSSGYSIDGERGRSWRGCRGFINKPYTLQMLSEKIREALSRCFSTISMSGNRFESPG